VYFEDNKPAKINWLGQSEKDFLDPTKVINKEKSLYLPFYKWNDTPPEKKSLYFRCS
jgi:hypothetical protein